MSADNGWILRQRNANEFVLQMYFASNENYPDINHPNAAVYSTLNDALIGYRQREAEYYPSEYGLTVDVWPKEESESSSMKVDTFIRKPFHVEAVRVTVDNMTDVAKWCGGDIRQGTKHPKDETEQNYIKINVHNPLNDKQTKAFVGDHVLFAGKGYKVYTHKAFVNNFDPTPGIEITTTTGGNNE